MLVSETRGYKVKTTAEAKVIAITYLSKYELEKNIKLGLPEIDDRYHIWRLSLLESKTGQHAGNVIINAIDGQILEDRTSTADYIKQIINSIDDKKVTTKSKNTLKTYPISPLESTVIHGDSTSVLDDLPENSIDLVFTSPPYYNARPEYNEYTSYEEYLEQIRTIIRKTARVLVEGRFFIMNISPVLLPRESRSHASTRLAVPFDMHRLFMEEGFEFVDDIHWVKPEGAGWASGRGRRFSADRNALQYKPVPVTEYILVYRKKTDKLIDWYIRKHPDQNLVEGSKILGEYDVTNIWKISPARDKRHRAIFPRELAKKVITYYSFKNDVVLDPFGGIGTTGKAALDLDRKFVMIEKEESYIDAMVSDFKSKYFDVYNAIDFQIPNHLREKYHLD